MSGGHDYTGNLEQILHRLERLNEKSDEHGEDLAAIKQHLSTLNGSVSRHEQQLDQLGKTVEGNSIRITNVGDRAIEDRAEAKKDRERLHDIRVEEGKSQVYRTAAERDRAKIKEVFEKLWDSIGQPAIAALLMYAITRVFNL